MHVNGCREKRPLNLKSPNSLAEAFLFLLEADQARMLRLCRSLEIVADCLPASAGLKITAKKIAFLDQAFSHHVFIHEKCLFALIRSLSEDAASVEPIIRQLECEHAADFALIFEITAAYTAAASPAHMRQEALSLGYLLRCFFENFRRHSVWEKAVLYPLLRTAFEMHAPKQQHAALLSLSVRGARAAYLKQPVTC